MKVLVQLDFETICVKQESELLQDGGGKRLYADVALSCFR